MLDYETVASREVSEITDWEHLPSSRSAGGPPGTKGILFRPAKGDWPRLRITDGRGWLKLDDGDGWTPVSVPDSLRITASATAGDLADF